ncbi:MAG: hypothetical protein IPP72_06405 [Chitinophagaceae bacterium]|nr:hypothetical protein [Chitinophagaceae bacterium]
METLLRIEGFKIIAGNDELYVFIIKIATGEIKFEQIVEWLKTNTTKS